MRKHMNQKVVFNVMAALVLLACVPTVQAVDDAADSYALLIQHSPAEAGTVTPGSGVHKIQIGQTVSLMAVPKPGYRFLYWLGDVTATDTSSTTIQVDSPKMVVAVFTREAYEEELPGVSLIKGAASRGGSAARLIGTPLSAGSAVNPGSYYNPGNLVINYPVLSSDSPTQFGEGSAFVPGIEPEEEEVKSENATEVPEPTTIMLLGLGTIGLSRRRTKN